jgi:hypothetical protein
MTQATAPIALGSFLPFTGLQGMSPPERLVGDTTRANQLGGYRCAFMKRVWKSRSTMEHLLYCVLVSECG